MENRSNNCKTQSNNRTASNSRSTHAANAANEHKHPNQYTKGADDEGAKNEDHRRQKRQKQQELPLSPESQGRAAGLNLSLP